MRMELLEAVAQVITLHCYWAHVSCLQHRQRYYTKFNGKAHHTTCRCLTLEATHSRGHYIQGQRWQIPEPDLDRVLSEMCSEDASLHQRCRLLCPTLNDVETLINRATYGVIKLDLTEEDCFTPVAPNSQQ